MKVKNGKQIMSSRNQSINQLTQKSFHGVTFMDEKANIYYIYFVKVAKGCIILSGD